jgi:hypothetical protein
MLRTVAREQFTLPMLAVVRTLATQLPEKPA